MASRSSRHVAVEEDQRWNNIHTDCDRYVFQTSLVLSSKKQVSSLVGGSLYKVAKQRGTEHITEFLNRSLHQLLKEHSVHHFATHNEETKASIVEVQSDTEDTYVALFHENQVSSIR